MKRRKLLFLVIIATSIFLLSTAENKAQTKVLENFENYASNTDLIQNWVFSGGASKSIEIVNDTTLKAAPGGNQYLKYVYSSVESTWGGIVERSANDNKFFPLNLSTTKAGIQFYLKGDGSKNVLRLRYYNQVGNSYAIWKSHPISLTDTKWHIVYVPFILDTDEKYGMRLAEGNGLYQETEEHLKESQGSIARLQLLVDTPDKGDAATHEIFIDDLRAVDFMPPVGVNAIKIADFEEYKESKDFQEKWQGFGYGTLDYELARDDQAPEGYKNALWIFKLEERTTWGIAFRNRQVLYKIPDLSKVGAEGGIQFLLKGDGSKDLFLFRFMDTNVNFWGSHWISLEDTSWHMVTIPLVVSATNGFRWLGNDPNATWWDLDVGTNEQLRASLGKIIEMRVDKRFFNSPIPPFIPNASPVHYDSLNSSICIDGLYAVDKFPPLEPRNADDFEEYTDNDNLQTSWNQFGSGSVALRLNQTDYKSGAKSMAITYNGANGYTAVRKRNIIPGINFSMLKGGMQYWLKGDGSDNSITIRLMSGDEMWESAPFPLKNTGWVRVGVKFAADSISGFRYLGSNPDEPLWSSNIGTNEQLLGDIANVDQIRFYIRNPKPTSIENTVLIDKIEGVDVFSKSTIITDIGPEDYNNLPYTYSLEQNYPNPFNPITKINYTLQNAENVTLKVFNILGQEVANLVNEHQKAGQYQIDFNASHLASGVYVYRIYAGSFVSAKKMVLIK